MKIKKYSETKEYSCSVCDCTIYDNKREAEQCFNSHKVKPGSVVKEKCKCCGHDVNKIIPTTKVIEQTYYFCNMCNEPYFKDKKAAEECYDSHFIKGKCFSCNKKITSLDYYDEHKNDFDGVVNAVILYAPNDQNESKEIPIMICFDCLKIATKNFKQQNNR